MTDDLDVAIRHVRTVALWHPTLIRRAPIGMYYLYEDRRIRVRACRVATSRLAAIFTLCLQARALRTSQSHG